MVFIKFLRATFVLPFTAGSSPFGRESPVYYDGTTAIPSIKIFAFSIVFMLSEMAMQSEAFVSFIGLSVFINCIVFLGLLSCLIITIAFKVKGPEAFMDKQSGTRNKRMHKMFLWIFGSASNVYCVIKSGYILECKGSSVLDMNHKMIIAYYIIMLAFIFMQIYFLTYLSSYRFKTSLPIQYTVLLVIFADLTIWIYDRHNNHDGFPSVINSTVDFNCTNSTFKHMMNVSNKVLPPVFNEYSMLAISMTHSLLPDLMTPEAGDGQNGCEERNDEINNDRLIICDDVSAESDLHTPLLRSGSHSYNSIERVGLLSASRETSPSATFLFYTVSLISGTLALSLLTGYLIDIVEKAGKTEDWTQVLELIFFILMISCTYMGYYLLCRDIKPPTISRPISLSEYIFIASAIGSLWACIFRILTSAKKSYYLIVVSRTLLAISAYIQTVFILHATRCSRRCKATNVHSLRKVLLLLCFYNVCCWVVESFLLLGFPNVRTDDKEYLGPDLWKIRTSVLHPLHVYYRFASSLELFELYKRFKIRKT